VARKNRSAPDHRRTAIAEEAARIIQEQGIADFRSAKDKAVQSLGLRKSPPLPSNREIEQALGTRNRLFRAEEHPRLLRQLRAAAVHIMAHLESFTPRLAGPVLSGHVNAHSLIDLHLFSDSAEDVAADLARHGIRPRCVQYRHRLRHDAAQAFPAYRFFAAECEFAVTVFPERYRGHPPLSPIDGRPMRRATRRDVAALLEAVSPG